MVSLLGSLRGKRAVVTTVLGGRWAGTIGQVHGQGITGLDSVDVELNNGSVHLAIRHIVSVEEV